MKKRSSTSFIGQLIAFWQKTETTLITLEELGDRLKDHPTLAEKSGEKLISFLKTYMGEVRQLSQKEGWPGKVINPVRKEGAIIGYRTSELAEAKDEKKVEVVSVGAGTRTKANDTWSKILKEAFNGDSPYDEYLVDTLARLKRLRFDSKGRMINNKIYRYAKKEFPSLLKRFEESALESELKTEGNGIKKPENSLSSGTVKAVRRKKGS